MVRRNRNPPWSDLPQELLSAIANFLTSNPISIITFRSVCCSWRSSLPPLSNSSLLSPLLPLSIPHGNYSSLSVTIIYVLHRPLQSSGIEPSSWSPDAWILFVDEFVSGKLSIRKPFLPCSYPTPINFPNNINLLEFNVHELGRFYNLNYSSNFQCSEIGDRHGLFFKLSKPRYCLASDVNKVVMFPNAPAAITLGVDGKLGMYRLDVGIVEYESKHDGKDFCFDDIVEYKGRVLGIDRRGRVYQINYHSSEITPFVPPIVSGEGRGNRLVESLGLLYLVVRGNDEPGKSDKGAIFKVYELNEGRKEWVEITSLGDRFFSFGVNYSFSASAQELGTCVKNCILFGGNSFQPDRGYDSDDTVFYNLRQWELDIGVWHLDDADHFGIIKSYPSYSDSLWPPPSWIWSIDRLKRIEIVETAVQEMLFRVVHFKEVVCFIKAQKVTLGTREGALEAVTDVRNLKTRVNKYHEEETEFMHDLREFLQILNKVESLCEQSGTSSHGTTKERPGSDNFKTSLTCQDRLWSTMSKLRTRYACLFYIEEEITLMEMYLKSLFDL